ncbi:MAG TPA: hypothetical protein VFE46_07965 [Pirellulales bacterium]|jgi:hypothetical protein|nr:hypothetical protein [Pirellulales bacterium]
MTGNLEDALVLFDGQKLFQAMHGIGAFIRGQASNNEHGLRVARLLDRVINDVAILDYEVAVEFTEPGQNHTVALEKLADDFDTKLTGRIIAGAKPLDNWQTWVPKDANAFSLNFGINLHELYSGIIQNVREEFPESQQGIDKFAALQEQIGVNFDRDILQSFNGESVCVAMPIKSDDGSVRQESVSGLRCSNPDKIKELLSCGVEALNKLPAMQTQQVKLEDCKDLEGFQALHAAILQMFGAIPVVGFRDGWMIVASNQEAAKEVFAVRAGKVELIDAAAGFKKLGINSNGTIYSLKYQEIGAIVRHVADIIDKVGAVAPMFLSMAAPMLSPRKSNQCKKFLNFCQASPKSFAGSITSATT